MEKTVIFVCLWGFACMYLCAAVCKMLGHNGPVFRFFVLAMAMFLIVGALVHALVGMAERRAGNFADDGPLIEHGEMQ